MQRLFWRDAFARYARLAHALLRVRLPGTRARHEPGDATLDKDLLAGRLAQLFPGNQCALHPAHQQRIFAM